MLPSKFKLLVLFTAFLLIGKLGILPLFSPSKPNNSHPPLTLAIPSKPSKFTFNVMGPLALINEQQWQEFEQQLKEVKAIGVQGVSIDVWWGMAEAKGDQQFDWSYYHRVANLLKKYELEWIPIMAFHQCGGNVGDTCNVPVPDWIWTHFEGVDPESLQFKSEQGNYAKETLAIWHEGELSRQVYKQYQEFMEAFESEFADYAPMIQELNISMGSAGEIRYPSYNGHDQGTGYPTRGGLQGFSDPALKNFETYLRVKYVDINSLNSRWNSNFKNFDEIQFSHNFNEIFALGDHFKSGLGRDYLTWYHRSLLNHGSKMLEAGHRGFSKAFKTIPFGYKIPGIHWKIAETGGLKRSAELASGLIGPSHYSEANAWGYAPILTIAKQFKDKTKRDVIIHFTALEMENNPTAPAFSGAKDLVSWMGQGAHNLGLKIKGENALAFGVHTKEGWANIRDALTHQHYSGLTVLRISDVTGKNIGKDEYQSTIAQFN